MIEQAEGVLRDLGFYDVRVRHHELKSSAAALPDLTKSAAPQQENAGNISHLARIEVGPMEMIKFLGNGVSAEVAQALKRLGYAHVTLDLQGYRRGSTNETLPQSALATPATRS
jgi:uncharacterized protein